MDSTEIIFLAVILIVVLTIDFIAAANSLARIRSHTRSDTWEWVHYKYLVRYMYDGDYIEYFYRNKYTAFISYLRLRSKCGCENVDYLVLSRIELIRIEVQTNSRKFTRKVKVNQWG